MSRAFAVAALLLAACGEAKPKAKADEATEPTGRLIGVDPERWGCELVLTQAQVGEVLGGPVRQVDSTLGVPVGVAKPCNYVLNLPTAVETWTVDFDCRTNAIATADTMIQQYAAQNAQLLAAVADASVEELTDDAGVVHAPSAATQVEVGKRALDSGQAIVFVDDDAPCYGRVAGPDPARRLTLARLAAAKLSPATAPMTPRAP
jgi:hypothetical protein